MGGTTSNGPDRRGTGGTPGTGGPAPGQAPGPFTWNGAKPAGTFDPKTFGTTLFGDLATAYSQGPKATIPSFNPYSPETKGLIDNGINALKGVAGGDWLKGGNPYFEQALTDTRNNTTADVNSTFNNNGRFGADIHAQGLAQGLASSENAARAANFENEWQRMLGAQGQGLGLSGLLDSKNAELIKSQQEQQAQLDPFNFIAKNYGLLTSGNGADANTNKPLSLWDILGGIGSVAGAIL